MKISYLPFSIIALFLSVTLVVSCNSERKKEAQAAQARGGGGGGKPPAPRVDGFIVQTSTVSEKLEVPGSLVADEATEIHPEVSGRIIGLYIKEGAYVSKGALLAKLYDADLQAQKRKLEVQMRIAQQTENRYDQLQKIGGISKQDYDVTALQVSNLRADLDIIRTSIAKTEIRAPFSGKLGLKAVSTGAYVTPQSIITSIQKTSGLRIDFSVPEKYSPQIKVGQFVNFTVEGTDRNYSAVIAATESGIQQTTRTLQIRAAVKGDQTGLVPGGFAKVRLTFDPDPNALLVPSQAIIPQARGKKVALYRDSTAKFIDVETGVRDSSMVQILSGIKKGDTIIVTGLLSVKPDSKVSINKITNQQR